VRRETAPDASLGGGPAELDAHVGQQTAHVREWGRQ
jgi:hypothetical protein